MQFDKHVNLLRGTIMTPPADPLMGEAFALYPGDEDRWEAGMPVTISPPDVQPDYDNSEIGYLTGVAGNVFTITRAAEGSLRQSVAVDWVITATVTAKSLEDIEDAVEANADKHFMVAFNLESEVTVNHNLGKYPAVTVIDSADEEVVTDVAYDDLNTLTISLAGIMSGSVICN